MAIIKELLLPILSIEEGFKSFYKNLWCIADDLIRQPSFNSKNETRGRPKKTDTS
jgi:hypothetical protein